MEDKLRSMRVNQNQRKNLIAAGRFGIGPLVSMGMVKPAEVPAPGPALLSGAGGAAAAVQGRAAASAGSRASGQDQRRQVWRKLHEDDGLQDLSAFLAPKRKPPSSVAAVNTVGIATNGLGSGMRREEKAFEFEDPEEFDIEGASSVRATASRPTAGARAKAASFKAIQGPTVEEVRHLQQLYEPKGVSQITPALEAKIGEIRDEELRRVKKEENRRREEWRKAWKQDKDKNKKKKAELAKSAPQEAEAESDENSGGSDASSEALKRRRLNQDGSISTKNMDHDQKRFWNEAVKGRVSNDNKGLTDAQLEARFQAEEAAAAKQNLMTESEVLAMLAGSGKDKVKVKKKEKTKDRGSRSRERRR